MKLASYIFVFLAGAVLADVTRPNAAAQDSVSARPEPVKAELDPAPLLPFAYDFMSFQIVNGKVEPRFYCSSRCRRESNERSKP